MARKLKKSEPSDLVTPPYNGAVAHQDGHYFDVEGYEVDIHTGKRVGKKGNKAKTKEPETVTPEPETETGDEDEGGEGSSSEDVVAEGRQALIAWYEDRQANKLTPFKVFALVSEVYGETTKNFEEARAMIAKAEGYEA